MNKSNIYGFQLIHKPRFACRGFFTVPFNFKSQKNREGEVGKMSLQGKVQVAGTTVPSSPLSRQGDQKPRTSGHQRASA